MVIRKGEEEPSIYQIRRDNGEYLLPDLSEIETETSIYFQKITVKEAGEEKFFPVCFAFHIGKEKENYNLKVNKSEGGTAFDTLQNKRGDYFFAYKNQTLLEIISDISGFKKHYLRTFGKAVNPLLDVEYTSEKINTRNGFGLTVSELRRRYRFSYRYKFETRSSYRLGLGNDIKLDNYLVAPDLAPNPSDEYTQTGENAVLAAATLQDLAEFIEKKFGVFIYVVVTKDDAYYFSLDVSSLDNLISQLENDYGLQLIHGNYPVRFLDVTFL